jgi:hypothetical protein
MRRTGVTLGLLALLVVGCGPARPSSGADSPTDATIDVSEVTTRIVGASPEQETILREILAGLGRDSLITSVQIRAPDGAPDTPATVAVDIHLAAGDTLRREWELALAADAFAARSRELGLPRVAELFVDGSSDSSLDGGEPFVDRREPITATGLSEKIRAAAKESEARIHRLELLRPDNLAMAVELQVDDPARFLANRADSFLAAFPWPDTAKYDGLLIEISDADGKVWSYSTAFSEDGSESIVGGIRRPELAGCDPMPPVGGPPDKPPPPPCPTDSKNDPTDSTKDPSDSLEIEWVEPAKVTARIIGGTPKQQMIIEETLAGLGQTSIESVQVYDKVDQAWAGATPDSVGIDIRSSKPDEFTRWQAWQVANAFGRRSSLLGLHPIGFVGINGDRAGGLDWSEDLADAPVTRAEAEKALRRVAEIAARHDASTSVRIFQLDRLAFAIEFVTAKPAEFLLHGFEPALAPTDAPNNDGRHVEVLDAKGGQILNGGWVRPDLLDCSPFVRFGGPLRPEPPPCPAK